jgi:hypothetical protein
MNSEINLKLKRYFYKIAKYQTIKEYCSLEKQLYCEPVFFNKIDFSDINDDQNLIHVRKNKSIDVLIYFDWFPHIMHFQFYYHNSYSLRQFNFIKRLFFDFQKINIKWNIFENHQKLHLNLKEYFIYLTLYCNSYQEYYLTENKKRKYKCDQCIFKDKIIYITNQYSMCEYFSKNIFEGDLCINWKCK